MADSPKPGQNAPDDDADLSQMRGRLDALEGQLAAHRPDPAAERDAKMERSSFGLAVRVSSDFIAAVFVGGALGWFLDSFAGTSPFGLIILLLLGFAAGVLNVMRTLGLVAMPKGLPAAPVSRTAARQHDTGKSGQ